jgi:hypothetical protein
MAEGTAVRDRAGDIVGERVGARVAVLKEGSAVGDRVSAYVGE